MFSQTCVADERLSAPVVLPSPLAMDQELLFAIAEGVVEALDMLYQRYHQGLYSLAYSIVGDHQIAEDLLQETFLRMWRHAATYSPQAGSVRAWLFTILRNQAIDYLRRQRQRSTPREVPLGEVECDDRLALADTWEEVWRREESAQIRAALARLTEKQRMVLELSYFQGYTHVEIAALSGLPLGTVKSSMRLGLQALKRELMKRGEREQEVAC